MTYAFHPQIFSCPEIWALPAAEFKLYAALLTFCRHDGTGAFPSNETLAEMVGVKPRSVQLALASLESLGVISRHVEHERNGVRGTWRSVLVHYVLGGRTTATLGRDNDRFTAQLVTCGAQSDDMGGAQSDARGGAQSDAPQRNTPRFEHSHNNKAEAVRDDGGEPFETISSAILPAPSKPAIPAGLSTLASQLGPHAERWLYSHVTSGTSPDDWRLATVLRETAGMNLRSPKLLEMKFNDLPEAKPAPAAGSAKPDRITTKDGKRVLINGKWVDSASPYPNQPALGEGPPPRLSQSSGYQKPAGRPLGGILGERVVEMTVAEQAANGAALAAKEKEAAESRLRAAEARAKIEADRVARKDLMKRRHDRQSDLMAQGKKLAEVGDILRREGLAE